MRGGGGLIAAYADLMLDITGTDVCFYVKAEEGPNPYGIAGESNSAVICTGIQENIFVANAFTPNGDNINDFFRPVMSFTPVEYQLIISDLRNKIVFETRDYELNWDGKFRGSALPQGVFIWYLKLKTPSGDIVSRTGTVTILKNQ